MDILILGTGDAFTRKSFGTSALIRAGSGFVLLDCPDPIHRVLREATERCGWSADATNIGDIIITHLHGDHSNGLESFGFYRRIARLTGKASDHIPRLHTSAAAAGRLWEKLAPAMDAPGPDGKSATLADFYDVRELRTERPNSIAGLTVECRFTKHPVPTLGLLISDGASTLGWSGDTPFEGAHIDWLSRADLIVHEANEGRAHTPIAELEALPDHIRSRLRLVHTPDDFDQDCTAIPLLRAGQLLEI